MDQLTSGLSGQTYRVGPALPGLGEGFYRGFAGAQEVTLRVAATGSPAVAALREEAGLLERIQHPQIAAPRDRGRTSDAFFLVFDGPAERPLAELIHQADLSPAAALDIVVQVADILAALHGAGLVWGRLRPQAFWLDKAGQLKLIDLRGAGVPIGHGVLTLAEATYVAPELSAGPPTERGDVYACGVLAYELLAGRPPFIGSAPTELAVRHLTEAPPELARLRPDLPADLVALIERCLSKQPEERPAGAATLRDELMVIRERVLAEEREHMVICPRCQGQVLPAERCPLCNAPLSTPDTAPTRRRSRLLPAIAIAISGLAIVCMLMSLLGGGDGATASAPTSSPAIVSPSPAATSTPLPAREPTVLPTATAEPALAGAITAPAGDVADPDIDMIAARAAVEADELVIDIAVVGQVGAPSDPRTYQVFLDSDGAAAGDHSTPWSTLGADYTVLYRGGDESGMVLRWHENAWQGIGAAQTDIQAGRLIMRIPREWLGTPETLRYGVLTTNPTANLADYAPARTEGAALAVGDK